MTADLPHRTSHADAAVSAALARVRVAEGDESPEPEEAL